MKHKFSSMWRVGIALVMVLSLGLVTAVPVAASHDSTATVAFAELASTQQGDDSTLDVKVTNSVGSFGNINEVVIDFTGTDFLVADDPVVTGPGNWVGTASVGIVTFTGDTIAPAADAAFVIPVTNPLELGLATNPTVKTSDSGSQAELEASADTGWVGYIADAIGTTGNSITVEYVDAAPWSVLIVSEVGNAISVELADDGTNPTSTATLVAGEINKGALVTATVAAGHEDDFVPVMGATALSGGSLEQLNKTCLVTGELEITEQLLTVAVTAIPSTSASLASYTIDFTTLEPILVGEMITITFPVEYDMAQVGVDAVDVTAYIFDEVVVVEGQVVTITDDGTNPIAAVAGAVQVTIDDVENPPASGDYDIAVLTTAAEHGDGEVTITPAAFGVVAGTENTVTAGTAFSVTVTALNAEVEAEIDTGYAGAHLIDFSSGATGAPTIPAFEKITFDAGVGTSSAYFILTLAGEAAVAINATEGTLMGVSDDITINPATFVKFDIAGVPTPVTAGVAFSPSITVTAQDADGNAVIGYTGTVTWDSSDDNALLPAAYTFTTGDGEDNGVHTFLGSLFTLKTVGEEPQTITVTDAAAVVSKESAAITVTPAAAASIVVSASPGVIEADNNDSATITVTAKDAFGNVDTNYTGVKGITIASSLGEIASADPAFISGEATTTLISDKKVGTATIRVTSAFDPETTTVKLLPDIGIESITVTVDQPMILNDGVDERTITATYEDSEGDVVATAEGADYAFTFSVVDPDTVLSTTEPVNAVAGVATVTLTTTAAPETSITVTANGIGAAAGDMVITVAGTSFPIPLFQGWNLISLPLIPFDSDIDMVLADADITVNKVTYYTGGPAGSWQLYTPDFGDLTQMKDGKGYWVDVSAGGDFTAIGVDLALPGLAPPTYDVVVGWNLIGFTGTSKLVTEYLGAVMETVQAMYSYSADTRAYSAVTGGVDLSPGYGYWLAVNAAGKIYP